MVNLAPYLALCSALAFTLVVAKEKKHHCSLETEISFDPGTSFQLKSLLTSIGENIVLKVDGKAVCTASSDLAIPDIHDPAIQNVCAAAGMSLNFVNIDAPVAMAGATALGMFLKVTTHFDVVDDFTKEKIGVKLMSPKFKCKAHFPKELNCKWLYRADFKCPSAKKPKGIPFKS